MSCLNEDQIADVIWKTFKDLKIHFEWDLRIQEEEKKQRDDLYILLLSCTSQQIESAKLSAFFENLLMTNHSLETILAATMHNIKPRAGNNIKNFSAINEWYRRLDQRYKFSLAPALLPLMTSENLKQLKNLEPPFLKDSETGLDHQGYNNLSELLHGNNENINGYLIKHFVFRQ